MFQYALPSLNAVKTAASAPAVVPPLAAGAQTTITFEPIPVVPGETYEVTAEVVVTDIDANFEDNVIVVTFRVNNE